MINSITTYKKKCYAVHLKAASPNVKLYSWDILKMKISAILMFRTSHFFNTSMEALVKVSAPLFMKALSFPA